MHYALKDKYPIETAEQVKTAVDYFDKFIGRFAPMDRVTAATNIEKRADDLSVDVDRDWITNYARVMKKEAQMSPDFDRNIEARKQLCQQRHTTVMAHGEQVKAAELLDRVLEHRDVMPNIVLMKAIAEFDKQASLTPEYDNRITDPVITVFGSLTNPKFDAVKVAGDMTDYDVRSATRNATKMEKVASKFGAKFSEKLKSNPVEAASNLRAPERAALVEALS